jgi:hypothetical protein
MSNKGKQQKKEGGGKRKGGKNSQAMCMVSGTDDRHKLLIKLGSDLAMTSVGLSNITYDLGAQLAAGVDVQNRLGRRCVVKRINFRGEVIGAQTNSVADDPWNTFRVIVAVIRSGSTPFTAGFSVNSQIDARYQSGIKMVLLDKAVVVQSPAKDSTGYIQAGKILEFDLRGLNIPFEYTTSAAGASSDYTIVINAVSDSAAVVNPGLSSNSSIGVYFE